MKQTKVFEAEDGTQFATAAECRAYEELDYLSGRLAGLSSAIVKHALSGVTNTDLAGALERAGNIIAKKRRASGDLKRGSLKQAKDAFLNVENAMKDVRK